MSRSAEKSVNPPVQQEGTFWLADFQDAGCSNLSESPRTNDSGNAKRKCSLVTTLFRIWQCEVGDDITAFFFDFHCSCHVPSGPCAAAGAPCAYDGGNDLPRKIGPRREMRPARRAA
jgi:hypothetical protein